MGTNAYELITGNQARARPDRARRPPGLTAPAWTAGLALAFLVAAGSAYAQAPTSPTTVFCHDSARGVVSEVLASDCRGEVVSAARAAEIRAERERRVQRAIQVPPDAEPADRRPSGIGTGFFVAGGGKVVTNNHVIEHCARIAIETPLGRRGAARVLATDPTADLALLESELPTQAVPTFRLGPVPVADTVIVVIGYPDQGLPPIQPVLVTGTLLPIWPSDDGVTRLQMRADVRRGNSGGPVIDPNGQVIGVVNAKLDTVKVYRKTGEVVRGIGFAIAAPSVLRFLADNQVEYRSAAQTVALPVAQVNDLARKLVVRVACWLP